MLRKLGVSRSGYNAWRHRLPSDTSIRRQEVKEQIQRIYDESHQNYGAPKITSELRKAGEIISERTVGLVYHTGVILFILCLKGLCYRRGNFCYIKLRKSAVSFDYLIHFSVNPLNLFFRPRFRSPYLIQIITIAKVKVNMKSQYVVYFFISLHKMCVSISRAPVSPVCGAAVSPPWREARPARMRSAPFEERTANR